MRRSELMSKGLRLLLRLQSSHLGCRLSSADISGWNGGNLQLLVPCRNTQVSSFSSIWGSVGAGSLCFTQPMLAASSKEQEVEGIFLFRSASSFRCFLGSSFHRYQALAIIQPKTRRTGAIAALGFTQKSWVGNDVDWKGISVRYIKKRGMNTQHAPKQLSLSVPVIIEESLPVSPELQAVTDQLQLDGQLLLELTTVNYKLAESANTIELSILLCDDKYIQKLNKQWLGKNSPTDVLSFPINEIPGLSSLLVLGDIVISMETAKQQAEERGHTLLDEVRILMVHGLLHVLGYDRERGPEAAKEMEEEEQHLMSKMGWTGKGLIQTSFDVDKES
ncbi:hypothetical protein O6H91_19G046100 [Diphasiastrum complanatum]|uniref:Uncharacterized protein n=1 Tax=Diphasiastrum complanatum TaxID=34168 RepID=A0ACC2AUR7_DIPCM|nr:hypothetical protein O6H91_19G046100 [Diphasiastrum complanatum]